jgi:hypothetical protein
VGLSHLGTGATTGLLYQPQMIDDGDCEVVGGMKIGKGNQSTRRKPPPTPLCPPQIQHDQTRARTRAAAVRSQRLTARAMARPKMYILHVSTKVGHFQVSLKMLMKLLCFSPSIQFLGTFPRLCAHVCYGDGSWMFVETCSVHTPVM